MVSGTAKHCVLAGKHDVLDVETEMEVGKEMVIVGAPKGRWEVILGVPKASCALRFDRKGYWY